MSELSKLSGKKIQTGLICLLVYYFIVNLLSLRLPFFWGDAIVQSSIAAQWYYDNNFSYFFLPIADNPGHPPFFGMYLAVWWKLFGQSLVVSHLAMLPFLLGIAWQFFHIAHYFLNDKFLFFGLILFALEPTILAQSTMVSPELPILFLFLLGLRSVLYKLKFWQTLAMCLIVLLNTRGIMLVVVIFLSEWLLNFTSLNARFWKKDNISPIQKIILLFKSIFQLIPKYIPAGLVALIWLFVHYFIEGWIGFNRENMPWRNSFIPVSGMGYVRNFAIFGWRLLDFGRIFMWLILAFLFAKILFSKTLSKNISQDKKLFGILALLFPPILVFFPIMIRYIGTLQHRYLLPFFALFVILVAYSLQLYFQEKRQWKWINLFMIIMSVGLISGHFWVYPDKVSQGWEASLSHLSYFQVRNKTNDYVFKNKLTKEKIATGSPNKYLLKHSDLINIPGKYQDIDEVKYDTLPYLIYSNIFNDFADSTYDDIHSRWILEKEFYSGKIRMSLFKNPDL